jgi:four helix bundle protein
MLENFDAYQIAKQYYWECKLLKLPQFLQDQLLSASSSIALNVSEGSGRRTPADQRKHYAYAYGSLQECRSILELEKIEAPTLIKLGDRLGAILYTLSRKKIIRKTKR